MRVILVGGGGIVYYLARQFLQEKLQTSIVTASHAEAVELSRRTSTTVLAGDATDPQVLAEAGAMQADAVLALTAHDEDNLAICQIARHMYKVPRTIALVNDPENEDIFHKLQVSVAISATRVLSLLFEEQAVFEEISKLIAVETGQVSVSELILGDDALAVGKFIEELPLPQEALIGGIIRGGKVLIPKGDTMLHGGDRLIVIATQESLHLTMHLLTGNGSA